jgi:hypothetical protein
MVNTLSGVNGSGPGSTRSCSLSKKPRSYSIKLTCQTWSSTSRMPTSWPENTLEKLILRLASGEACWAGQTDQPLHACHSVSSSDRTPYARSQSTGRSALHVDVHLLHAEGFSAARPRASFVLLLSCRSPLRMNLREELNVSRIYSDFTRNSRYSIDDRGYSIPWFGTAMPFFGIAANQSPAAKKENQKRYPKPAS